uniref:Uncharacterized protein n=1 Tax=Panagrolaimus sp. PS1159 TaxID=55785 RepID=A0AC35F5H6_9BILA
MRGYFIGLLLCVSFVFGDNSVNGHEMDQERIPSEAAVEPLDPPPYCTERQAEAYVKEACGVINIAASCSDGQKMVDCAEKELRIKCSKEMVQEACDNWLPEFLKKIHSS